MATWMKALSLKVSFFAALLATVSFLMAGVTTSFVVVTALFCLTLTTMLQNDWRDRWHDVRKGKVLAAENQHAFLALLLTAWVVSIVLIALAIPRDIRTGGLLVIIACVALTYSEVRRVPMLSIILVALTSASPVLFPIVLGISSASLWLLFSASAFIIVAREITRDLEDMPIDPGYKWTPPLILGERRAKVVAVFSASVGLAVVAAVSLWSLPGALIALYGVVLLLKGEKTITSRTYIDCGMAVVLLTLLAVQLLGLPL